MTLLGMVLFSVDVAVTSPLTRKVTVHHCPDGNDGIPMPTVVSGVALPTVPAVRLTVLPAHVPPVAVVSKNIPDGKLSGITTFVQSAPVLLYNSMYIIDTPEPVGILVGPNALLKP